MITSHENREQLLLCFQHIEPKKHHRTQCVVLELVPLRSKKKHSSQARKQDLGTSQEFFSKFPTSNTPLPVLFIWESPNPGSYFAEISLDNMSQLNQRLLAQLFCSLLLELCALFYFQLYTIEYWEMIQNKRGKVEFSFCIRGSGWGGGTNISCQLKFWPFVSCQLIGF